MSVKAGRQNEGLMMMQELDDRLKEQIDKLEHIRLSVGDLKESLSGNSSKDLKQSISEHMDWLSHLTERVETLQMNTTVFVQMTTKPRSWKGKQGHRQFSCWGRSHLADDAQSEYGWSPMRTGATVMLPLKCPVPGNPGKETTELTEQHLEWMLHCGPLSDHHS